LEQNLDLDVADAKHNTVLHRAIKKGSLYMVHNLIMKGYNIQAEAEAEGENGIMPIDLAKIMGREHLLLSLQSALPYADYEVRESDLVFNGEVELSVIEENDQIPNAEVPAVAAEILQRVELFSRLGAVRAPSSWVTRIGASSTAIAMRDNPINSLGS